MWDPELEERKREQAMAKVKLPPLQGLHSKPGESVSRECLTQDEKIFRHYLESSRCVRERYFLRKDHEWWTLTNLEAARQLYEPAKSWLRTFCEEKRRLGRLKVESRNVTTPGQDKG